MDKKPNINQYKIVEKAVKEVFKMYYASTRSGAYDFPDEKEWVNEEFKLFRRNNPKLFGLKYDKENKDWVFEYEGGLHRVIL